MTTLLAVGAAILDCVYVLDELPVVAQKYRAKSLSLQGGGMAATAAVTAARLGVNVALAARVGDDTFGAAIAAELIKEGVDCSLVRRWPGRHSAVSAVMIDKSGERMLVNYKDPNMESGTDWLPKELPGNIDGVLGDSHWEAGTSHFFRLAREAGKPAILDADRRMASPDILANATHIGFSARALREYSGIEALPKALAQFQAGLAGWLTVTDGENGAWFIGEGGICHEPAFKVAAVETNGAGDVWHGAFAVAILEGQEPRSAVRFANAAAAIKCSRLGGRAGIPSRAEIANLTANETA
ncbi:MAG: PfkB family carbohydrate kinase [Rhodomicrobium sp.]